MELKTFSADCASCASAKLQRRSQWRSNRRAAREPRAGNYKAEECRRIRDEYTKNHPHALRKEVIAAICDATRLGRSQVYGYISNSPRGKAAVKDAVAMSAGLRTKRVGDRVVRFQPRTKPDKFFSGLQETRINGGFSYFCGLSGDAE